MPVPSASLLRRRALRLHPLVACLAAALLMPSGHAGVRSAAVHGTVQVSTCDDAGPGSLREAVAAAADGDVVELGGLGCDTITLSSGPIGIGVANLSLVGPGREGLTISGGDAQRVFDHAGNGTLSLSGLSVAHGTAADGGGCIRSAGSLALDDVVVSSCVAGTPDTADVAGGGASVAGNATLTDADFLDNRADGTQRVRGGALAVGGSLRATTSRFTGNRAHSHDASGGNPMQNLAEGGAIHVLADAELVDSTISGNTAQSDTFEVFGGGLAVGSHPDDVAGSLELLRTEVSGNTVVSGCPVCAPQGGGIAAVGITRLRRSVVLDNTVGSTGFYGGAGGLRVFDAASAEIIDSTISGNHADSAGGGLIGPSEGYLTLDGSLVTDNFAGNQGGTQEGGGGVLCFSCTIQVSSSTVSGNTAEANGGGIGILFGESAPGTSTVVDSTISGNVGAEGGGFMLDGGRLRVSNSTIAFNLASTRGAGISGTEYAYAIELQSSIVADNATGGAANNVWAFPDTVEGANNLIPNAPGLPASMPADTLTGDPLLLPLADNGGRTPTHALGEGSPAIDAGNNTLGLVFDQRGEGYAREVGAAADIGAFEQQPPGPDDVIFRDGFDAGQ
ncbi:right-handed parallel beta-helix repeat-containing protein [Dokdonella sp.]|uniref:right-handed parallel beta-helix repeat-containing protein n=1 Tax=Dokdonella sp. TaxID=2291710 RepID=UPI001B29CCAE|nr:right-handed parallel beta-helix repeat-containing protein [Dokdonella sp.]MBO9664383.1 right-handed parallel beta-helix repeat-containing protein [Dokdonella sp.]